MLISAGMFLFAAGNLISIYLDYKKGADTYDELQEYVQEKGAEEVQEPERKPEPEAEMEVTEGDWLQIDFAGLQAQNPDTAGWIVIPALKVSYPVVQGEDNDYYLHHMFDRQEHKNGSIFIDCHNRPGFTDQNTIIYGHNMKDGSMFGTLDRYQEKRLYQEYPCFYIYVPGYVLVYRIFSCYVGKSGGSAYTYYFPEKEDFKEFLSKIQFYGAYETGVEAKETDKIVTLSTCVNTDLNYRYLVHGKLEEKLVNKGDNYVYKK